MDQTVRLDSLLSDRGFCSRRKVESFILGNKVTINGESARQPGQRVNLQSDELIVNGKKVELLNQKDLVYYVINKTKGKVVTELVPNKVRVYPVGKLDEQSTGLILLTNDGDLAHKLTNPRYQIPKTYLVWVVGNPSEKRLDRIREGMKLREGWAKPTSVKILKSSPKRTLVEVILNESKNHQIRGMFAKVGINIVELKRVGLGSIQLEHLGLAKYRELSATELKNLKDEVEVQVKLSEESK